MFDQTTFSIIASIAEPRGINPAALAAVVEIESNGITFARIEGRNVPLIRIEGHYFDRLVPASKQKAARAAGLASPKAGAVKNPNRVITTVNTNRKTLNQNMHHLFGSP